MTPFSKHIPTLQIAWDKTSLGALQFCPQYYKYTIIDGWRASGNDTQFGSYFASAVERYSKAMLEHGDKERAVRDTLRWLIDNSGQWIANENGDVWLPWGGSYERLWRCKGKEKYKNAKGNAAKCPFSHKGKWFSDPQPPMCGECGGETESEVRYIPDTPDKNRHTLIRLVLWWMDEQPAIGQGGLHPVRMPDGSPAIEASFTMPLPWDTPDGDTYMLCGHIDRLVAIGDRPVTLGDPDAEIFGSDNKTTKKTLNRGFFDSYASSLDVSVYGFALDMLYPGLTQGMVIEGAQTLQSGAAFASQEYRISKAQQEEFYRELRTSITLAEFYAQDGYWPKFRRNCWLCAFKRVCAAEPERREALLREGFEKKHWNPLVER